ncbi:MAG TPA: tetratricopeptide repeat protein, partial [Nitrospiria bacterium]
MITALQKAAPLAALLALTGCGAFPKIIVLHDPLSPQQHVDLGTTYEASSDLSAAEKEYRTALDGDPRLVPALIALGNLLTERGDFRQAEKLYRRALKQSPDHPMANNNLAWILIEQDGNLEEAETRIDRALGGDPRHRAFYLDTRANLYLHRGQTDR